MDSGLTPGALIDGKYRIHRLIGSGGMGAVYEGENVRIGRRVAIKVLHSRIALDRKLVARFEREAQAVARIGSHHVADVLDLGELSTGDRYMVMEYLKGETLAERLANAGPLPPADVIAIALQLLDGLSMMHDAGIIHRDLKPGNIFLVKSRSGSGDFVKILDFGICKFEAAHDAQWTTAGATVLGTPGYLSPEQLSTDDSAIVNAQADLFAIGIILYRCIAGRLPYDAETKAELLLKIRDGIHVPIADVIPDIDQGLAEIITKSIAFSPPDRYQTAKVFREALLVWAQGAEQREKLLAEFLDRPQTTSFVPAPASHPPPRFMRDVDSLGLVALSEVSEAAATSFEPTTPDVLTEAAPITAPIEKVASPQQRQQQQQQSSPATPPMAMQVSPPSSPKVSVVGNPNPPPARRVPPSTLKTIVVGAALGVAGVVILYMTVLGR